MARGLPVVNRMIREVPSKDYLSESLKEVREQVTLTFLQRARRWRDEDFEAETRVSGERTGWRGAAGEPGEGGQSRRT